MSQGNVVDLCGPDMQKLRKALADLSSPDDKVFKTAYHWVFNSQFFLEDGFEMTCERAGVSLVAMIEKTEQRRPGLRLRFERLLFEGGTA